MTDAEKIAFLRAEELMIGWTPGTPFESATVKLDMSRGPDYLDYFSMSEIIELCEYYSKLSFMVTVGQTLSPADRFTFHILNTNKIFDAFNALYEEMNNDKAQSSTKS